LSWAGLVLPAGYDGASFGIGCYLGYRLMTGLGWTDGRWDIIWDRGWDLGRTKGVYPGKQALAAAAFADGARAASELLGFGGKQLAWLWLDQVSVRIGTKALGEGRDESRSPRAGRIPTYTSTVYPTLGGVSPSLLYHPSIYQRWPVTPW
jgi:hypothetical protein